MSQFKCQKSLNLVFYREFDYDFNKNGEHFTGTVAQFCDYYGNIWKFGGKVSDLLVGLSVGCEVRAICEFSFYKGKIIRKVIKIENKL